MTGPQKPIAVLAARQDRHLFEDIHDARIRVLADATGPAEPDLIVVPCGQDRRLDKVADLQFPPQVQTRLAEGRAAVVFDASTEGTPHKPDVTASLHAFLSRHGVSPERAVYVTQERNYDADYRTHCAAHGIRPMSAVLNHDYWIWFAFASYAAEGERHYLERRESFRRRGAHRSRRFLSLNRTPRPSKILFLMNLIHDGLWDRGFVSFGGFRSEGPGKVRPSIGQLRTALPGFDDKLVEYAPHLDALDARGRVLLGMEQHGWSKLALWNAGQASDLAEYHESWFSVVTETEMRGRPSRITEKVLKPLVNFHPMLVLGNPGSLKLVRSYGFQSFPDIIDESYDETFDPRRRYDEVYREFTRLCRLGEEELRGLEAQVADTLDFNARWGLTEFPTRFRQQYDEALVNGILGAVGLNAAPA